jgi:ABC-type sugar transport system ATPase subunit
MTPVLEVNSMSKTFGEQVVLNQVSLKVEAGEIRALVGQNG